MSEKIDIGSLAKAVELNGYCLLHDYCQMQGGGEDTPLLDKLNSLDKSQVDQLKGKLHHRFPHHVSGIGYMPSVEVSTDKDGHISSLTFRPSTLDTAANSGIVVEGVSGK
jgi:hypothetical protein